jgi:hypothetical protein
VTVVCVLLVQHLFMNYVDDKFLEQWTNITFLLSLETQYCSMFVKMDKWMEHWLLYGLSNFKIEGKKDITT